MEHATQYYLGGNTAEGFYSLYSGFCPPESGDFLWVIKGGPGCGKSSFMRRIGAAMEQAGLDVEYVLCSGDPDSLDGVYIPALRTGYVDGTAPHVQEAVYPCASGLYLDLGQFYDRAALQPKRSEILALNTHYKALYQESYELLAACPPPNAGDAEEPLAYLPPCSGKTGRLNRRFLRAVSCKGLVSVPDVSCRSVRELHSPQTLDRLAKAAQQAGYDAVCAQHPIFPRMCESVRIPALDTVYFTGYAALDAACAPLLRAACAKLAEAKALHDKLEAVYNPHVDFDGVYALAEQHIQMLKIQNFAL
ncbi:MAG: hypothetical protein MRZ24_01940 [Clostridiales bacterium]|nr:hypothetical protein [Clostridiales bacterium]